MEAQITGHLSMSQAVTPEHLSQQAWVGPGDKLLAVSEVRWGRIVSTMTQQRNLESQPEASLSLSCAYLVFVMTW